MKKAFIFFLCMLSSVSATIPKNPSVVIVFVIDQFAYYYLTRHATDFKAGGFNKFMKEGVVYTNAYHLHGMPETSPGHTTLSTGALPHTHGVSSNRWFSADGTEIGFGIDDNKATAVLAAPARAGGRSPHHIDVDTLSDQMSMHQATHTNYKAYSIGIKDTATIATAGQKGPAFWFNLYQGGFTSSRHYMNGLPRWVKQFNERCGIRQLKKIAWPLCYPKQDPAYDYPYIDNYDYAAYPFKMADRTDIAIDHSQESPFDLYLKTPAANQLILDFAHCCIKNVYKKLKHEKLLLWTCLSPLDLVGHRYGPDSREVIDMLYHLDGQLAHSMEKIERMLGSTNVSFVLTADHGIQPIPEISRLRGYKKAHRVMANSLIEKINTQVKAECGVDDFITHFESTYFIYNSDAVAQLEQNEGAFNQAQNIALSILREQPGIRQVWTYDELKEGSYTPFSAEQFYKNHIFKHRLGDLIVQPEPYSLVTNYPSGCSHNSSYKYDTNVVIGFYQKGIKPQLIKTRVATTQLAPTLAQMLDIPAPSSSMANPLPHILSGVEA